MKKLIQIGECILNGTSVDFGTDAGLLSVQKV